MALLDSWISLKRIDEYLKAPELKNVTTDGSTISFNHASISWPSDDSDHSDHSTLEDVNISFPKGQLSIISGPTGCGKSLLLSAILGECDVLAGTIAAPKTVAHRNRYDDMALESNWIIPGSIAYVAQIPWIENASVKENILFGLPFNEERYNKAIEACALEKDLDVMPDGDGTEIGANGINISGGQRWRVTLCRALYSRAEILVLDDIFSAVDTHVGRHILEQALTGELSEGRTRILATHHVGLCRPNAQYLVELANNKVLIAGPLTGSPPNGRLNESLNGEQLEQTECLGDNAPSTSETSTYIVHEETGKANPKAKPRRFVEEEKREKGSVKHHVYAAYLKASGGWFFWPFIFLVFLIVQALAIGEKSAMHPALPMQDWD
jgi:ABC-type nitrate/sulfonate/bicarbonate transport system ATPase subunit